MSIGRTLYHSLKGDKYIWLIILMLSACSLLAVYSATGSLSYKVAGGNTEFYLIKHGLIVAFGLLLTWLIYHIQYMHFNRLAPWLLLITIPLLLYTSLFGVNINEARRWITLPLIGLTFQSSDFAKLALIIYVARMISLKQDYIKDFKQAFLPILIPVVLVCGLIAMADFSTAFMLFTTCVLMMFIGRVDMKYILTLIFLGIVIVLMLMVMGTFFPDFIRVETWISRITEFAASGNEGYQIEQAKIAIADGGWFGLGPGNSLQRNYLPSPYSDFIYAIICEEYGLIGAFTILFLYLFLFIRCVVIVTKCPKAFGTILAAGLGLNIVIQAFLNLAVSVDLVPVTGLTLPLVSMGGTSLLFTSIAFGIILGVSRFVEEYKTETVRIEHKVDSEGLDHAPDY